MKTKTATLFSALILLSVILTACRPPPAGPSLVDQAQTAAVQTLTAMPSATPFVPSATDTPQPTATVTSTATVAPSPTPAVYGPANFPANINPLTGLAVSDPAILDRRPVMIKVANFPRSGRPHAGFSAADIVFEYYIGEGTNRFMALYYGQDAEQVGPIRSGRLVDAQLVPMYGGILGYSGAYVAVDEPIREALGDRLFMSSPSTCPAICAGATVISHFADTAAFTKLAVANGVDNTRPNLDGMKFATTPPTGGTPAQTVNVMYNQFNQGEWRYDKSSGEYIRWIEDVDANNNLILVELVDRNNDEPVAFENVVVLFADYIEYAPTMNDTDITGNTTGQRAIIYRDGQAFEVQWKSAGVDKPIQFFLESGEPFPLKPGSTWINIMGSASTVEETEAGKVQVQFYMP